MYKHQSKALEFLVKRPYAGLFLPMGSGKTLTMLKLIETYKAIYNLTWLIIAPPLTTNVWPAEIQKHGLKLNFAVINSSVKPAKRDALLKGLNDVVVLSDTLLEYYKNDIPHFNACVIDEIGRMRSSDSKKFKTLKKLRPSFKFFYGLTGTPAPNGLYSMYGIIRLIDNGASFKYLKDWEAMFTYKLSPQGYKFAINPTPIGQQTIERVVNELSFSCEPCFDFPLVTQDIVIPPDEVFTKAYNGFVKNKVLEVQDKVLTASTMSSMITKLIQYTSGFMYTEAGEPLRMNRLKLTALKELLDECEGQNVLVIYWFREDRRIILDEIPGSEILDIEKWNSGGQRIALAHPASCGHGLNLQTGGHIMVWYTLLFDLELYQQMRKRLARPGQTHTVIEKRLVIGSTVDEVIIKRLDGKAQVQQDLIDGVIEYLGLGV
jgi:hypothetical protein